MPEVADTLDIVDALGDVIEETEREVAGTFELG